MALRLTEIKLCFATAVKLFDYLHSNTYRCKCWRGMGVGDGYGVWHSQALSIPFTPRCPSLPGSSYYQDRCYLVTLNELFVIVTQTENHTQWHTR